MIMESAEDRQIRIRQKSKKQFLLLIAVFIGISVYIAFFAGDSFLEVAPEHAEE